MEVTTPSTADRKKLRRDKQKERKEHKKHKKELKKRRRSTGDDGLPPSFEDSKQESRSRMSLDSSNGSVPAVKLEADAAEETVLKDDAPLKVSSSPIQEESVASHEDSAGAAIEIRVKESSPDFDPVVVSFPGGVPASILVKEAKQQTAVTFSVDGEDGEPAPSNEAPLFTCSRLRPGSSRGKIVQGRDSTCVYSASNEGRGHDNRLTKLYVAVLDRRARTLTLHPTAEKGTVFSLSQSVPSYVPHGASSLLSTSMQNISSADRRRVLFESFGSAKKQKSLRSQAANVVTIDNVVGAGQGMMEAMGKQTALLSDSNKKIMEDTKQGTKTNAIEESYAEARRNFLPPFDPNADSPHKVYDAQEIAGDDAWAQISRQVDNDASLTNNNLPSSDWRQSFQLQIGPSSSPSVQSLLDRINPTKKGAKYQMKAILLLNYLIKFHTYCTTKPTLNGNAVRISKSIGLPLEATTRFLHLFAVSTESGRFAISKTLRDKRTIYILISYLLANGREMKVANIGELCRELKLDAKEASILLREAGCNCKRSTTNNDGGGMSLLSVSLSVPLTFPPPKRSTKTGAR